MNYNTWLQELQYLMYHNFSYTWLQHPTPPYNSLHSSPLRHLLQIVLCLYIKRIMLVSAATRVRGHHPCRPFMVCHYDKNFNLSFINCRWDKGWLVANDRGQFMSVVCWWWSIIRQFMSYWRKYKSCMIVSGARVFSRRLAVVRAEC